ncbi:MAG: hypothetical protein IPL53_21660 [Ignavibacteria bacterium]|nr:hypothetical protein [Ignavibacteria bacterium]
MQNSGEMFGYTNTYFKNGNVKSQELSGSYNDNFAKTDELTFNYTYDKSNRLLLAVRSGGSSFRVENAYASAGNITMLKRYNGDGNIIDSFAYSYNSGTNKLRKVTGSADQYTYDNNGNMIRETEQSKLPQSSLFS